MVEDRATTVVSSDVTTYRGDSARSGQMPGPGPTKEAVIRWTFEAGAPIKSQAVVVGGTVYLVSTDGVVHALDPGTGSETWHATVGARTYSSPTVANDLVIVGAEDGMHALQADEGGPAWMTNSTGPIRGTAAAVDDLVICASTTGLISALDVDSGTMRWARQVAGGSDTSVAAADGLVVVGLDDGTLIGLEVADGGERWRADIGDGGRIRTPTITDGRVFVATLDGGTGCHIASLDFATGEVEWRVASPGGETAYSPAQAEATLVHANTRGLFESCGARSGFQRRWRAA